MAGASLWAIFGVCIGIPDYRLGEVLCAAVSLKSNHSLDSNTLKEFLVNRLAAFKIPLHIRIQEDALPKVGSGKFDKPFLRNEFVTFLQQND